MAKQQPVIFAYQQVITTERVQPQNLADWERRMRELVGIDAKIVLQAGYVETDSSCPAPTFDD